MNVLSYAYRRESGAVALLALFMATNSPHTVTEAVLSADEVNLMSGALVDCTCCQTAYVAPCVHINVGRRDVSLLLAFLQAEQHVLCDSHVAWPGLRDRLNTAGRGKPERGLAGCCEPVPFEVRKLDSMFKSFYFFSNFFFFSAPFLSNYSLPSTSEKIVPGRTISQHF